MTTTYSKLNCFLIINKQLLSRSPWCYLADGINEKGINWEYCYNSACQSTKPAILTTQATIPKLNFTTLGNIRVTI